MTTAQEGRSRRLETALAAGVALALALLWIPGMDRQYAWGWDESMHAALPALRMLVALREGEFALASEALLSCSQYPFGWPVVLALVQAVTGMSEFACRAAGTLAWCATLLGIFLLVREIAPRRVAAWIAFALAALSPLALAFAGTLFLEVPFACASVFALRAWLRRGAPGGGARRELAAGAWITIALFTKWNYGLLLGAGLFLDLVVEGVIALRAGAASTFLRRTAWLALVPALALAWWFVLPLPGGPARGAEHRETLFAFLGGNRDLPPTPYSLRFLHAAGWLALSPRMLLLVVLGALAALALPRTRALWLVLLALAIPTLLHPFHLERFLIPIAVPLWALAALGIAHHLPARPATSAAILAGLALLTISFPVSGTLQLARGLGWQSPDEAVAAYQRSVVEGWKRLDGGRPLPTAGLARAEHDALLDLAARAAGANERVAWLGVSSEFSPAAIHIGLLERGGSPARFLRDAHRPMDVTYFGADPAWSDAQLAGFVSGFDVVLATRPPDLKGRGGRAFMDGYRERLVSVLGWREQTLGEVPISRPMGRTEAVTLLAYRPPR